MNTDVQHQIGLIKIYRRNLELLTRQRAAFGNNLVPQHINSGIEEARDKINGIKTILREHYNVVVEDMPGIDFDDVEMITIRVDRITYNKIKLIVGDYGIELPDV